jgi:transcription elongation factor Elf1
MQQAGGSILPSQSNRDIIFTCVHCSAVYVVDAAAAGMTLTCQKCGQPTTVPQTAAVEQPSANSSRISDLQHQLKENESQRTEITGYINQLGIQLHRWQLRLQTLKERQAKLEAELAELGGGGGQVGSDSKAAASGTATTTAG